MTGRAYKARKGVHRRRVRDKAHVAFDQVWERGIMPREEAYRRIGELLGRTAGRSHFGTLTPGQMTRVRSWALSVLANHKRTLLSVLPHDSKEK